MFSAFVVHGSQSTFFNSLVIILTFLITFVTPLIFFLVTGCLEPTLCTPEESIKDILNNKVSFKFIKKAYEKEITNIFKKIIFYLVLVFIFSGYVISATDSIIIEFIVVIFSLVASIVMPFLFFAILNSKS